MLKNFGITPSKEQETEKIITVSRNTDSYLGILSLIILLNLAALTYPHESTSRYPKMPAYLVGQEQVIGLGCEDYNYSLGIVNRLGWLGYATGVMLAELKPQLANIADFFEIKQISKPPPDAEST